MFKILHKTLTTGTVTLPYPANEGTISAQFRGRPDFDFPRWADARPAADACPTGAISIRDREASREVTVDYGRCVFCGECAEASTDRKSTRLNSSHSSISYAVFCLKKKKKK